MATTSVGGAQVGYEVLEGSGSDVVLVHCTGGSALQWATVAPALAPRWRVVVPELSGTAATVDAGQPLTVEGLVEQVVAVADAAGAQRFHLAGYSLGAALSLAVAAEVPERVRSVVAVCGWSRSGPDLAMRFRLWEDLVRLDRDAFARYLVATAGTERWLAEHGAGLDQFAAAVAATLAPGTDRHAALDQVLDVDDRLGRITAPTLVIGATEDRILPIGHSRHLAEAVAGAELVEVEANHLYPLEQPADLAARLDGFFERHDGSR